MSGKDEATDRDVAKFRRTFLAGMILIVGALTVLGLSLAERNVAAETQHDATVAFDSELTLLQTARELRHAVLSERCRALVKKPRLHAALEDDALDLLYLSARDELQDVMGSYVAAEGVARPSTLSATFYRFLGADGKVIPARDADDVGRLSQVDEAKIHFSGIPIEQQTGCISVKSPQGETSVLEIIATPIVSTESGEPIAALVVGFNPVEFSRPRAAGEMKSGIWLDGVLHLPSLAAPDRLAVGAKIDELGGHLPANPRNLSVEVGGLPHLLFFQPLNPASNMAPAYEVGLYSLADLLARQSSLRWQVLGAGGVLLLIGSGLSYFISARLAAPVQKLAIVSEENRILRERAEASLSVKTEALQRTARFSADASHQLKTPVAVMRAGLDEVLATGNLSKEAREEISMLVHQTFRLTSIIDDLLLLSRLDSSRMKLEFGPVDLNRLIETCMDDLGLLPDEMPLEIDTDVQADLCVAGEHRYTMLILQNLFENARKYNRPGGRIRVSSEVRGDSVFLRIANTGIPIPAEARERIFERFHRGGMGETIPGHGLGLNLARELARIHGGDLRLARSDAEWTEFEARFVLFQKDPHQREAA